MTTRTKEQPSAQESLELLFHISRELAAALDLRTVLQRMLLLSMQNVGASSGSIIVLDDKGQPSDSAFLLHGKTHDQTQLNLYLTFEQGLAGWVAQNRQAALLLNTSQDDRWLRRPDDEESQTGPKSALSIPILAREQLIGVMTLVHPSPGFFGQDHLALVRAIGDQAGIAILNARLYAESQRTARVMTALAESATAITASLDLNDVLQQILEQTSHALQVEVVSLALLDSQGKELIYLASTGSRRKKVVGAHIPLGQGIAGWVAREGQAVIIPDIKQEHRFDPIIDDLTDFKTKAVACAPIRSQNQIIGILEALNPIKESFDADALVVLTGIGSLAGTTIQHAQLFESLQAAHRRYRELFEDSIDPILVTDLHGQILEANRQAELTVGIDLTKTDQGVTIDSLFEIDHDQVGAGFEHLIAGKIVSYESILHEKSGHDMFIQVYTRRVDIDGIPHIQWILRDITERKNLDRLREDLISMIYHDLRSPLSNVTSSLDVLASMLPEDENPAFLSLLSIAERSTERLQRLTNSLLDISRLEAGQPIGKRKSANPSELINEAIETVIAIAQSKEIGIEVKTADHLSRIFVDEDMVRRVLINLLENAIKYSPSGGNILIGAEQDGEFVRFSVKDVGRGIPSKDQETIFEKFVQIGETTSYRSLGLGLSFCRLAVRGHGGRIWVESEPGSGSIFYFTLPVVTKSNKELVVG